MNTSPGVQDSAYNRKNAQILFDCLAEEFYRTGFDSMEFDICMFVEWCEWI